MNDLQKEGFELVHGIFSKDGIEVMHNEADRVSKEAGPACVRHLRKKSKEFGRLAISERLKCPLLSELSPAQSIFFNKTPDKSWSVASHQDLTITVKEEIGVDGYGPSCTFPRRNRTV